VTSGAAAGVRLTIDLSALAANWRRVAAEAAPAECGAVVKADACGLGIEQAVPALVAAGCRTFFIALPEEGRRVRTVAPDATIYVLGGFFADAADAYRAAELRPILNHEEELSAWMAQGGRPAALHVDTGMNRLGFELAKARALDAAALRAAGVSFVMSHLACADEPTHPANARQLARFRDIRKAFPAFPASLANSAGVFLGKDYHFDLVRPGIALYGAEYRKGAALDVVVTAEARILQVRTVEAGATIGYGGEQMLARPSRVAILAAGYADGYIRSAGASDRRAGASVCLRGRHAPLVGRVSMDLMAADVTDVPGDVRPGEHVELFGPNLPIDEVATAAGTIAYELLTQLSRRAERRYVGAPEGH
jgi:alanine racemase